MSDNTSSTSTLSTVKFEYIIDKLRNEKHRSSTRKNYYTVWKLFNKFILCLDHHPRKWEDRLSLFVGYMVNNRNKSTTIHSYVSAIKSVLADVGVVIQEDRYLLSSLTKACRLINDNVHVRLPIGKDMLYVLLCNVKHMFQLPRPNVSFSIVSSCICDNVLQSSKNKQGCC